jgi:hypothetical protein
VIIYAHAQISILFIHEQNGWTIRWFIQPNVSSFHQVVNLNLELL